MARLGGAELHFPGDYHSPSREAARAKFLKVIEKRPNSRVVFEALKSDVGPLHSDVLFRQSGGAYYMRQVVLMAKLGVRPRVRPRKLATRQELRKALEAWADRFNLARGGKGKWIYKVAEDTLRRWKTSRQDAERLISDGPDLVGLEFGPEEPWVFKFLTWDPTWLTRSKPPSPEGEGFDGRLNSTEPALQAGSFKYENRRLGTRRVSIYFAMPRRLRSRCWPRSTLAPTGVPQSPKIRQQMVRRP